VPTELAQSVTTSALNGAGSVSATRLGTTLTTTLASLAWRNLWRNRRRTLLSAAGVGFAVFLMVFSWSLQLGTFGMMFENATALMTGHIQVVNESSIDDPALRHTVPGVAELAAKLRQHPRVLAATVRTSAFALISAEERSFGGQVMGVDPRREPTLSSLPGRITEGRYLRGSGEAVLGVVLARNLGLEVGDEVVVLGSAKEGGVAALAATVVGILETDIAQLDRSLMQVPLADFQEGFGLENEGHSVVLILDDLNAAETVAAELGQDRWLNGQHGLVLRSWRELLPDLQQLHDMKMAGQQVFFALLGIMVTFTTFNTFAMTVYERTREFGMLLAVGMRPGSIIALLQLEAVLLCLLGIGGGLLASIGLIQVLAEVGIPLGEQLGDMMRQYHLPTHYYPELSMGGMVPPALLMFIALQLAALIPTLRVRRLQPATAMRTDA
jgi:putative ABC transport system permease protein